MNEKSSDTESAAPLEEDPIETMKRLPGMPIDERRRAIELLLRDSHVSIRQRALAMGAVLLSEDQLIGYIRMDGDDILRNAGLEILKARGSRSLALAIRLLGDDDPDIVLQAVLVLDHLRDSRSLDPLRDVLGHPDINVVQAALLAMGRLGDARAHADIVRFLGGDPWLQMAAIRALGHLRSQKAVARLEKLLSDLLVGPIAAEALAQIGGPRALQALGRHWMEFREDIDTEPFLSQLACTAITMKKPPELRAGARASIGAELDSADEATKLSAARCLLSLGAGPEDQKSLEVLIAASGESSHLPDCLEHRADLVPRLLEMPGATRAWAMRLALVARVEVPGERLLDVLRTPVDRVTVELAATLLEKAHPAPESASRLVDVFVGLPPEQRPFLVPALKRQRAAVQANVDLREDLDEEARLSVEIVTSSRAKPLAAWIAAVLEEIRLRVLPLALSRPPLLRLLPWGTWLEQHPEEYAEIAARVIREAGLKELVTPMRLALDRSSQPEPAIVRVLGELHDRESVPILVEKLRADASPRLRAQILESLGRIGGIDARSVLREAAGHSPAPESRVAYRALASCATEEDSPFFRESASHSDWAVRLACVEALGRSLASEDWPVLVSLAADPVAAVSHKAMACLQA